MEWILFIGPPEVENSMMRERPVPGAGNPSCRQRERPLHVPACPRVCCIHASPPGGAPGL